MRCGWESVSAMINGGVAELLDARRRETLYRIGVDEICYRHPHRYLTIVVITTPARDRHPARTQ